MIRGNFYGLVSVVHTLARSKGWQIKELQSVVYVDFNKAFDKVPFGRLLQKIRAHGNQGKLVRLDPKLIYVL